MKKVSSIVAVALLSVSFLFTACRENTGEATQSETPAADTTAVQEAPAAAPADTTQQAAPADTTQQAQ